MKSNNYNNNKDKSYRSYFLSHRDEHLTKFHENALTHYQMKNLDFSKLKEFADDNFKSDKNGRKLSKRVENIVGKGEIARYEQLLLFPQCFQKACFPGASKGVFVWEWVNPFPNKPWFSCVCNTDFENTV